MSEVLSHYIHKIPPCSFKGFTYIILFDYHKGPVKEGTTHMYFKGKGADA